MPQVSSSELLYFKSPAGTVLISSIPTGRPPSRWVSHSCFWRWCAEAIQKMQQQQLCITLVEGKKKIEKKKSESCFQLDFFPAIQVLFPDIMKITNTYSNKTPVGSIRVLTALGRVSQWVEIGPSYFELATIWRESDALLWTPWIHWHSELFIHVLFFGSIHYFHRITGSSLTREQVSQNLQLIYHY